MRIQASQAATVLSSTIATAPSSNGKAAHPELPTERVDQSDYMELYHLVSGEGLLDKQPLYYAWKLGSTAAMLGASIWLLVIANALWVHLLNAVFLGFVFAQFGFLGHDAGHRQMFRSGRNNEIVLFFVNLVILLDRSWWIDKHNRHHAHPNDLDRDRDVDLPFLAFTEDVALSKRGIYRLVVRYQAFCMYPLMMAEALSLRMDGFQYLLRGKNVKYMFAETSCIVLHLAIYLGALFYLLEPWHAVSFILVHQVVTGFYLANVFAPNHKGMLLLYKDTRLDFLRQQVLTARNIRSNPITDFMYGGLNNQIEHHLFPTMPRNKLRKASKLIIGFCVARGVPCHQTGVLGSQKEILQHLHQVSAPLRRGRRQGVLNKS